MALDLQSLVNQFKLGGSSPQGESSRMLQTNQNAGMGYITGQSKARAAAAAK
jgi:hypothetical protein